MTISVRSILIGLFLTSVFVSCESESEKPKSIRKAQPRIPSIAYAVDTILPHGIKSFTEGLSVIDGVIYESTGSPQYFPETKSVYGPLNDSTGEIEIVNELEERYFGEGMTVLNGKVYQVTYTAQTGFVYDFESGKRIKTFTYPNKEGWGMTNDGTHIIMSDGSSKLTYFDPESLKPVKELVVTENGRMLENLNELEYVNGVIYANVFMTDLIVRIDPATGKITGKLDITDLKRKALNAYPQSLETNGVAYDSERDMLLVTGKMWPYIFRIKLLG